MIHFNSFMNIVGAEDLNKQVIIGIDQKTYVLSIKRQFR